MSLLNHLVLINSKAIDIFANKVSKNAEKSAKISASTAKCFCRLACRNYSFMLQLNVTSKQTTITIPALLNPMATVL